MAHQARAAGAPNRLLPSSATELSTLPSVANVCFFCYALAHFAERIEPSGARAQMEK